MGIPKRVITTPEHLLPSCPLGNSATTPQSSGVNTVAEINFQTYRAPLDPRIALFNSYQVSITLKSTGVLCWTILF